MEENSNVVNETQNIPVVQEQPVVVQTPVVPTAEVEVNMVQNAEVIPAAPTAEVEVNMVQNVEVIPVAPPAPAEAQTPVQTPAIAPTQNIMTPGLAVEGTENTQAIEDLKKLDVLREKNIDVDSGVNILGDVDTYLRYQQDFHQNIKEKFGKLIECKATKDLTGYTVESNYIKNYSNYLGYDDLYALAKEHENKSAENNYDFIVEHLKEYEDEIIRITDLLEAFYNGTLIVTTQEGQADK